MSFKQNFVKEETMKALTCLLIIGLIAGILAISPDTASAQIQCKSKVTTTSWSEWTPYYNACNSEMKTTFAYTRDSDGSPEMWCEVENTPFLQIYDAGSCPGNSGTVVDWTHCTTLTNHRLLMDGQPTIGLPGFIPPCSFTAEYFASQGN